MNLNDVKLNCFCKVKQIKNICESINIRILELGIVEGVKIKVVRKSLMKNTLLIIFNNSCFTISKKIANDIVVDYE